MSRSIRRDSNAKGVIDTVIFSFCISFLWTLSDMNGLKTLSRKKKRNGTKGRNRSRRRKAMRKSDHLEQYRS